MLQPRVRISVGDAAQPQPPGVAAVDGPDEAGIAARQIRACPRTTVGRHRLHVCELGEWPHLERDAGLTSAERALPVSRTRRSVVDNLREAAEVAREASRAPVARGVDGKGSAPLRRHNQVDRDGQPTAALEIEPAVVAGTVADRHRRRRPLARTTRSRGRACPAASTPGVTAALCVRAVGSSNVLCVRMPERDVGDDSSALGADLAEQLGCATVEEPITRRPRGARVLPTPG